jgi:hypothetical protein
MPHDPTITPLFTTTDPFELDGYLHVEVGDEVLGGFLGRDEETRKDERAQRVVEAAMRRHGPRLGKGAKAALEYDLWQGMTWVRTQFDPSRGRFSSLARSVERTVIRRFYQKKEHTPRNLLRELDDEKDRAQAQRDDTSMVRYLARWKKRLSQLQRGHGRRARRWNVPGLDAEELRDRLAVDLLAAVKNKDFEDGEFDRAGSESTFIYLAKRVDKLKRGRLFVDILSYNFGAEDDVTALAHHAPSPESLAIHRDAGLVAKEIFARASELGLSRTQMRWIKAFMLEARGAAQNNTKINAARVAANMGRDRASASRMLKSIAAQISASYGDKEDLLP